MRDVDANGNGNMYHTAHLRHDAFTTNIAASTDALEENKKRHSDSTIQSSILSVASELLQQKKNRFAPLSIQWLYIISINMFQIHFVINYANRSFSDELSLTSSKTERINDNSCMC